jgi:outer membrane protein
MTKHWLRIVIALYLAASLATGTPLFAQAAGQQASQSQQQAKPPVAVTYPSLLSLRDYTKGNRTFPNIFSAYRSENVAHPNLTNAPSIYSLIQNGQLNLSLQDAIALALENNLDIAVSEYTPWIDQTNLLNAEGGGTPLGSVVIGSGGGGSFDPAISFFSSISDSSESINNPLTSGVGTSSGTITQTSHSTQTGISYTQEFHTGTTFAVQLSNTRSSISPSAALFNPSVSSQLAVQLSQPLLNRFGLLPTTRFILEAKNTDEIGRLQFQIQVIASVTQVEIQYWNLVLDREGVETAKQTLALYQKQYDDDVSLLKIGTGTPADVVYAQSSIAGGTQTLMGAQTAEQVQAAVLMNLLTKDPSDPRLKGLEVVPTTPLENAPTVPNMTMDDAVNEAWADRPELKVDQFALKNDDIEVRATRNALLPSLNLGAEYISSGLSGNTAGPFIPNGTFSPSNTLIVDQTGAPVLTGTGGEEFTGIPNGTIGPGTTGGISNAYSQIFHNVSPTYAASLNLNLPLRNRSAQAANAQRQLTERADQTLHQRDKSAVYSSVKEAYTQINLDSAQVQEAVKATSLAQQAYDYEVQKFNFGTADTFLVISYAQGLNGAKLAEIQAKTNYEIALASFNEAIGSTLAANNITIANNDSGNINLFAPDPKIPGTINGRLLESDALGDDMR